jgi:hypothetical protein
VLLRQRVALDVSELSAAVRPQHDAADEAVENRGQAPDRVDVVAGVGEVDAVAADWALRQSLVDLASVCELLAGELEPPSAA